MLEMFFFWCRKVKNNFMMSLLSILIPSFKIPLLENWLNLLQACAARFPTEFQKVVHIYGILSKGWCFGGLSIF